MASNEEQEAFEKGNDTSKALSELLNVAQAKNTDLLKSRDQEINELRMQLKDKMQRIVVLEIKLEEFDEDKKEAEEKMHHRLRDIERRHEDDMRKYQIDLNDYMQNAQGAMVDMERKLEKAKKETEVLRHLQEVQVEVIKDLEDKLMLERNASKLYKDTIRDLEQEKTQLVKMLGRLKLDASRSSQTDPHIELEMLKNWAKKALEKVKVLEMENKAAKLQVHELKKALQEKDTAQQNGNASSQHNPPSESSTLNLTCNSEQTGTPEESNHSNMLSISNEKKDKSNVSIACNIDTEHVKSINDTQNPKELPPNTSNNCTDKLGVDAEKPIYLNSFINANEIPPKKDTLNDSEPNRPNIKQDGKKSENKPSSDKIQAQNSVGVLNKEIDWKIKTDQECIMSTEPIVDDNAEKKDKNHKQSFENINAQVSDSTTRITENYLDEKEIDVGTE